MGAPAGKTCEAPPGVRRVPGTRQRRRQRLRAVGCASTTCLGSLRADMLRSYMRFKRALVLEPPPTGRVSCPRRQAERRPQIGDAADEFLLAVVHGADVNVEIVLLAEVSATGGHGARNGFLGRGVRERMLHLDVASKLALRCASLVADLASGRMHQSQMILQNAVGGEADSSTLVLAIRAPEPQASMDACLVALQPSCGVKGPSTRLRRA